MSYDSICGVLVFVEKIGNSGESNLIDVLVNLLLGHSNASVADGECALFGVELQFYSEFSEFSLEVTFVCKGFQFLCRVNGIAHHFAQEYLMIRIQELFYHGENVLCCNPNVSFLHDYILYKLISKYSFYKSRAKLSGCTFALFRLHIIIYVRA